eukprot:SAG31_NODE_4664_length_3056_cov_3.064592_1_plen_40_part_00
MHAMPPMEHGSDSAERGSDRRGYYIFKIMMWWWQNIRNI